MAQLFSRRSNLLARLVLFGGLVGIALVTLALVAFNDSPYATGLHDPISQPVPFSHQHHVQALGLDCRYCHTAVETSSDAGMPATQTCMTCHSQIWKDAPMLSPVRASLALDRPLVWNRVHHLPEYVYFHHGVHVAHGVGCVSCHGRVDEMPLVRKERSLRMGWCLGCHRAPERWLPPRETVFDLAWHPPGDRQELGQSLVRRYQIPTGRLTACYVCHR